MKAKTTRRALLMSALSLLLCVSMLVGTTFAWFTDSVTSGRNTIQAGNLDVVLEYWDGDSYEEVTSTTKLFDDAALWEPGYTEVAYLKVSNAGSLALKYQLAVNVYNETEGKTKDGTSITLSDYLQFKVVESDTDLVGAYASREDAQNANATATKLQTYNSEIKPLDAKNEAGDNNYYDYVALIIYMPTTVENEANHDGTNVPSIEMGVTLLATQRASESDSFDNTYDNKAVCDDEVQEEAQPWHELDAVQADTVVDGGGKTYAADYQEVALVGDADITIKGVTFQNGLTVYTNYEATGTIRLENCTIYLNNGNGNPSNGTMTQYRADHGLIIGAVSPNVTWEFVNCKFKAYDNHTYTNTSSYNAYILGNYSAESISFNGCTFEGSGKHGIGCSYSYGPNQDTIPFTYFNLNVTGCNFLDWNNCSTMGGNGAAIRGNVPAEILAQFNKRINISGNSFGESNGSTQATVAIDGWSGSWN